MVANLKKIDHPDTFPGVTRGSTKKLGLIGSAVLTQGVKKVRWNTIGSSQNQKKANCRNNILKYVLKGPVCLRNFKSPINKDTFETII